MVEYILSLIVVVVIAAFYKFWQTQNIYQYVEKYEILLDAVLSFVYRASVDAETIKLYEEEAAKCGVDPRMLFVIAMTQQFAKRINLRVDVEWIISTVERILAESKDIKP